MGVSILSIGKGSPGENNVPGDTFTNRELLNKLQKGLNFWQRVGFSLSRAQREKAYKALDVFEKVSGVKQRQMFVSDTLYPNETLATAACLDAIKEAERRDPSFNKSKIDGVIAVTDTQDTIFPISGKAIAAALNIQPRHFANASMACSSIVDAIWQACSWMEKDARCNNILISACDVTSRLHQAKAMQQPFLFGDQAVAMILRREPGNGGFLISNVFVDTKAPDIIHSALYTGDSEESKSSFWASDFGNDINLKEFGRYESQAIAGLYRLYMANNADVTSKDPYKTITTVDGLKTQVAIDEQFIAPQVAKKVAQRGSESAGIDCSLLDANAVKSTVPEHGITGAAGTPLAMYYLNKQALQLPRFTSFICAIGGISAVMTYDPNASEILKYKYEITPGVVDGTSLPEITSTGTTRSHLPNIDVTVKQGSVKPKQAHTTISDIVNEIHQTLSIKA